ncbi:hypothetical protein V1478_017108 [Vespula squamosa]|uniref:Uncharacterized protein n=1 Tax=Vespula squamosa TaxID=30214 RepID=A0ABD2A0V5_VESSQ
MGRKRRRLRWSRELNEEAEGGTAAGSGGCHETLEDDADRPTGPQPLPLLLPRIWRDNEVPSLFSLFISLACKQNEDPIHENNRDLILLKAARTK